MALRIVNNIAAMNTQRWLGVSDAGMKKSLERLSSGYRLNRAADDAAGLAISQAFRADIASFKVASRNTSEAKSLLQVAEGAMDQIANMLTRLKELATQASSANAGLELAKIDAEKEELLTEIERIANVTEYAGSKLINGDFGGRTGTITGGATTTTNSYGIGVDVNDVMDYSQKIKFADVGNTLYIRNLGVVGANTTISYLRENSDLYTFNEGSGANAVTMEFSGTERNAIEGNTYTFTAAAGGATLTLTDGKGFTEVETAFGGDSVVFADLGIKLSVTAGVLTTVLDGGDIQYVETGLSGTTWSTDGSVDTSLIGDLTVLSNTSVAMTLQTGTGTQYLGAISAAGDKMVFANLGLTIDLDGDYWEANDDVVGLSLTQSTGTFTGTSNIAITMSKTGLAEGVYSIDKVSATTVSIGNGSFTEYAAINANVVTFAELGITLTGAGGTAVLLTADMLGNDDLVVTNTGITALSIGASTTTGTWTIAHAADQITVEQGTTSQIESGSAGAIVDFDQLGIKISFGDDYAAGALNSLAISVTDINSKDFQVGAANDPNDRISVTIGDVRKDALGITGLDLLSTASAQAALDTIDDAISSLGTTRGSIGAAMNRLDYAYANLASTIENVQAAESVIRDVDMAAEMTDFTKNQILLQAGTAMLAQANMAPQQVLALFG